VRQHRHRTTRDQAHQHAVVALERGERLFERPVLGAGLLLPVFARRQDVGSLCLGHARGRVRAVVRIRHEGAGAAFPGRGATGSHRRSLALLVRRYQGDHESPAGRRTAPSHGLGSVSACGSEDAAAANCAGAVLRGASDHSTARPNDRNKRPNRRGRSDACAGAGKCQRFSINESFPFEAPHRPNHWPMTVPQPDSLRVYLGAVLGVLNRGAVRAATQAAVHPERCVLSTVRDESVRAGVPMVRASPTASPRCSRRALWSRGLSSS
jgi:hypothetical protein